MEHGAKHESLISLRSTASWVADKGAVGRAWFLIELERSSDCGRGVVRVAPCLGFGFFVGGDPGRRNNGSSVKSARCERNVSIDRPVSGGVLVRVERGGRRKKRKQWRIDAVCCG